VCASWFRSALVIVSQLRLTYNFLHRSSPSSCWIMCWAIRMILTRALALSYSTGNTTHTPPPLTLCSLLGHSMHGPHSGVRYLLSCIFLGRLFQMTTTQIALTGTNPTPDIPPSLMLPREGTQTITQPGVKTMAITETLTRQLIPVHLSWELGGKE
jgi:hypothetical protein